MTTLDDLFNALPPAPPETEAEKKRRQAKRDKEFERGVRLGWHDKDGNAIKCDDEENDDDES